MKILICTGSYRTNGNTARLVHMIGKALQGQAAEHAQILDIETICLARQEISLCRGCRTCFDRGEAYCPLQDDMGSIKTGMQAADALLLATPVYVNDVSGAVKNWMDRLAYVCHRPEFAGKSAYLLATSGSGPTRHALRTMEMALRSWGYHIAGSSGFKSGAHMAQSELEATFGGPARQIARTLYQAVDKDLSAKPSFLNLMSFNIQQRYWQKSQQTSLDHAYWTDRGWTDPACTYYIPHRANRGKVFLARLAGSALAPIVT